MAAKNKKTVTTPEKAKKPAVVNRPNTRTALGKTPSTTPTKSTPGKREQGIHKNNKGQWVNKEGLRVDGYGRLLPNQKPPKQTPAKPTKPTTPGGTTTPPTEEEKFKAMSPEKQDAATREQSGAFVNQTLQGAMGYDVNDPTKNYQMGFENSMNKAYGNVMDQFNRSMQPEFERQNAEFNQRMAEQGIDPNSGSYQAQFRALQNSQNEARQNAMNQATQQAYAVQQQGFAQQQGAYMTPFQAMQVGIVPWATQYGSEQDLAKQRLANQAQLEATRMSSGATVAGARIGAEADKYGYDLRALTEGYNQNKQPNLTNTIIGAGVQGAVQGIVK